MQDAIILGGGISGLTAAYLAQKKGLEVTVLEKATLPGGPIATVRTEGYLVEKGPNSLLLPDPWVETLIADLGLEQNLVETNPAASKRYIAKGGYPVPVPASLLQAVSTPLFSLRGKLGFLLEPFRKRISDKAAESETVADFVKRRMGTDFLDYAIDPFVSGVYAGDPNKLILQYAFPLMRGFERDGGSIVRGAIKYRRKRKREGRAYKKRSVSFYEGLGSLPATVAKKLGNRLWLGSEAVAVQRMEDAWQVTWKRDGETFNGMAKQLVVCLPSHATKRIQWTERIGTRIQSAPDLDYPAVHSLALGFRRDQIPHPLDGFGLLVPGKEPHAILGALFSSSLFPGRAPDGKCLLTVMIGGTRHPEFSDRAPNQLVEIALRDLSSLLGLKGEPNFYQCATWKQAIPQYTTEFGLWRDTLRSLEDDHPGLHFGGNSVDGIAMGASILSGKRLADSLTPSRLSR